MTATDPSILGSDVDRPSYDEFRASAAQFLADAVAADDHCPAFGAIMPPAFHARARAWQRRMYEAGYAGIHWPVEYGGRGLDRSYTAIWSEECAKARVQPYLNLQGLILAGEAILRSGTDEQKVRFLRPTLAGEFLWCQLFSEPNAGSDLASLTTTAVRDGDAYVLRGHKWFTSSADGAAFAIAMAVTNPDAPRPHERASMLLVPMDAPGVEIVRNLPVMGEAGGGWASHAEVRFHDVRVPAEDRLGAEGAGFALAQERLGPGRIHHCMRWIGICERAFDLMCARAAGRELSPGEPLGRQQAVQFWVAESRAEIDAARLLVLHTADRIEREGQRAARDDVSAIKFHVAGVLGRVLDRAIQVHGALGMTYETPLAFWFAHERAARIYDGPDEVHKSALGKRILQRYGMPRSRE